MAATLAPLPKEIEQRLSWQEHVGQPPRERLLKVGTALPALKEIEYFGVVQPGTPGVRLPGLVERVLMPSEDRWTAGRHVGEVMARVKRLRSAILLEMVQGGRTGQEKASRWRQLGDSYLVQQLPCYPGEYLDEPTPERMPETAERSEEDLADTARPHPPIRAVITVGGAIEPGIRSSAPDSRCRALTRKGWRFRSGLHPKMPPRGPKALARQMMVPNGGDQLRIPG